MSAGSKRLATAIALFLVFTVSEVYVGVSFAGSAAKAAPAVVVAVTPDPQQATAILTTHGNKAISVNGTTSISGATLVSGANISTPDGVGATVNLGALGTLDIAANTNLTLEFDQSGNVRVMLRGGCVTLHTKKGTSGEVNTVQGRGGATDPLKDSVLEVCLPVGATAPIVTVGGVVAPAATAGGGLLGLGTAATVAIIGGLGAAATTIVLTARGANPSPGSP